MAQEPLIVTLNVDPNHYAKAKRVLGDEGALLALLSTVIERVATEEINPLMPPKRVFEKPKAFTSAPQDSLFDEPVVPAKPLNVSLRPAVRVPSTAWPTLEKPMAIESTPRTHSAPTWMHPSSALASLPSMKEEIPLSSNTPDVETLSELPPLEVHRPEQSESASLALSAPLPIEKAPVITDMTSVERVLTDPVEAQPTSSNPSSLWSRAKMKTQQAYSEAVSSLAWRDRERTSIMNTPDWTPKHPLYCAPDHPKAVLETKTFRMDKSLLIQHPFKDAIIAEMTRQLNFVVDGLPAPDVKPMGPDGVYGITLDYPEHPWMAIWLCTKNDVMLIRGGHPDQLFESE